MDALVVYYSRSGNTRRLAREIAEHIGCDIDEICPEENYSGVLGFLKSLLHAGLNRHPRIQQPKKEPSDYEVVILGTPVWAGKAAAPVKTYSEEHKHKISALALFCTKSSSPHEGVFSEVEDILNKKGEAYLAVTRKELDQDCLKSKVKTFIEQVFPGTRVR
jgi:flavodoxin